MSRSFNDEEDFYATGYRAGFTKGQLDFMWNYCYALDKVIEDIE